MRRPPRKNAVSYILPFFLLGIIIAAAVYYISTASFSFGAGMPALLEVKEPEVKVLLKNNDVWRTVPENVNIKLFKGDAIKTTASGESKINLLKDSFIYLDADTSIKINELRESDSFQRTNISLISGKILASVARIINPKSSFTLQLEDTQIQSRGAEFLLEGNLIQVMKGKVIVKKLNKGKVFANTELGVGQQLDLSEPESGAFHEIEALSTEIYASPWLEKALGKKVEQMDKKVTAGDELQVLEESSEEISSSDTDKTITSSPSEKTSAEPEENSLRIDNLEGVAINEIIEINTDSYQITGIVSANTEKVIVNDYTLSKFEKGDTSFEYNARTVYGNLKEGENIFTVQAFFEDGESLSESFTVNYTPKEEEKEETEISEEVTSTEKDIKEEPTPTETTENALTLSVISPEEDAKIDSDPVTVRGTAPEGTAKIMIGDYTLRTFKQGDTQWKYNASQAYDNLTPGELNKYLITALDEDDNEIASITFKFFSTAEVSE